LEPEILVIDEVLAVGDINFQKKCLGKMGDVAKQGRTVLFVSHNMAAIQSLCSRGIMLDAGRITCAGTVQDVVKKYFQTSEALESVPLKQRVDRSGDGSARIISIRIENVNGGKIIHSSSRLKITLHYESTKPLQYPRFLISVKDATTTGIFLLNSEGGDRLPDVLPAHGRIVCVTDPIHLTPGRCSVDLGLIKGIGVVADDVRSATFLDVEPDDVFGAHAPSRSDALCLIKQQWTLTDGDPVLG
jgi:lipopolysaccharide transport system ATP-binding protein